MSWRGYRKQRLQSGFERKICEKVKKQRPQSGFKSEHACPLTCVMMGNPRSLGISSVMSTGLKYDSPKIGFLLVNLEIRVLARDLAAANM